MGVAMGAGGSAMAVAAADIVLMSDSLHKLPHTIQLSKAARNIIIQNCALSVGIKLLACALATVGLFMW